MRNNIKMVHYKYKSDILNLISQAVRAEEEDVTEMCKAGLEFTDLRCKKQRLGPTSDKTATRNIQTVLRRLIEIRFGII